MVSPTLSVEALDAILTATRPFRKEGHFLYPADSRGSHLSSFFYLAKMLGHPGAVSLVVNDLSRWLSASGHPVDLIFAPNDQPVRTLVEALSKEIGKPAAYLEYLPTGRFGEVVEHADLLKPGTKVLVFNGVSATGRCVGVRLPSFVEKAGAEVSAIAAFAKGSASGVRAAEEAFGPRFYSAIELNIPLYVPESCPLCESGIPLVPWNAPG